ncbi:MAG: DUF475 domain-containing protein [Leadbetterella sp.]
MSFFENLSVLWNDIIATPGKSLSIVFNLVVIESLLSVDNAAVLATMVNDLPKEEKSKALKYGIWGAYFFRGLALLFVSLLTKIWWLKLLGGLYLIYLVYDWFRSKRTSHHEDDTLDKKSNWFYRNTVGLIGNFWATVCLVEIMDLAFSIDNVFAASALSKNIILICAGVFIGILAMRFVTQWFVKLMERYSFLEGSAFVVIGILGLKLSLVVVEEFFPNSGFTSILKSHTTELVLSVVNMSIFFLPILTSTLFNFPKHKD